MQEATASNPPLSRGIVALIVAPAVLALPLLLLVGVFAIPFAITSYGVTWLFFAPIYFILRRHFIITIGMNLVIGAGAGLLASLVATASSEAIDIYLSGYSAAVAFAVPAFASTAKFLIAISAVTSFVFGLIAFPLVKGAAFMPVFSVPIAASSAAGRSRTLLALALLYLGLPPGVYWWTLQKYLAAEAADGGIVELYERENTASPNPIVVQIPRAFRYQSRDGRTGQWKDYKHHETSLRTFYPTFSSPRDPPNVARGFHHTCIGYCDDETRIAVSNIALALADGTVSTNADVAAKTFSRLHRHFEAHAENQFGFDKVSDATSAAALGSRLWLKSNNGKAGHSLAAECSLNTPRQVCKLFFSLECNPAIGVEVDGWYYERMDEAMEVRRRVEAFVSSMVKEPKCGM